MRTGVFLWITGILLSSLSINGVLAQASFQYAYLIAEKGDSTLMSILTVVPSDFGIETQQLSYSPPKNYGLPIRTIASSPNGEWIALMVLARDQSNLIFQLVNLSTGETRNIAQGYLSGHGSAIAWSPNSQYVAVNFNETGVEDLEIYVYSVAAQTFTNVTNDEQNQVDIGWSTDSSHILTFTEVCRNCQSRLDIYDVINSQLESYINLSDITLLGSNACNPLASPTNMEIAFISNCGFDAAAQVDFPSDVYIWDVATNRLEQVTYLDLEVDGRYAADFHVAWFDPQTFLIGVDYQVSTMREFRRLLAYNVFTNETTILRSDVGRDFAINPVNNQFAVRQELNVGGDEEVNEVQVITAQVSAETNVLSLDTISLSTDVPEGCGLDWSPDGTLLAHFVYTDHCQGAITSVVFVNPFTGLVQEHPLSSDGLTADDYVVPIGWVAR